MSGTLVGGRDLVIIVQNLLASIGLYRGHVTGTLTSDTVKAIKDFQRSSELTATGEIDAYLLVRLSREVLVQSEEPPAKPGES